MKFVTVLRPLAVAALLLSAGTANAEIRTFHFTAKVNYTSDANLAPVGSVVQGSFSYDTETAPQLKMEGWANYRIASYLTASVNGHQILSDNLGVDVWNNYGHYSDTVQVSGSYPMVLDDTVYPDGGFYLVLVGAPKDTTILNDTKLPVHLEVPRFSPTLSYGQLRRDGKEDGTFLQFSIESIVDDCFKANGQVAKNNCTAD